MKGNPLTDQLVAFAGRLQESFSVKHHDLSLTGGNQAGLFKLSQGVGNRRAVHSQHLGEQVVLLHRSLGGKAEDDLLNPRGAEDHPADLVRKYHAAGRRSDRVGFGPARQLQNVGLRWEIVWPALRVDSADQAL